MDWHNFKVIAMYAVIVFVFLLLIGQIAMAFIALIGYLLYGWLDCIKAFRYYKKWEKCFSDTVNEKVKEIALCHITKRKDKLHENDVSAFVEALNDTKYSLIVKTLTAIHTVSPRESDDGVTYYLEVDHENSVYYVSGSLACRCSVGDKVYFLSAACETAIVVKTKTELRNILFHIIFQKSNLPS